MNSSQDADRNGPAAQRPPVILDTDIGGDIDDTWALCMLLGLAGRVDLKLITTATGDAPERARLVAKILERAGRTEIPVGVGTTTAEYTPNQAAWLGDWEPSGYAGEILADGVAAMVDAVKACPGKMTIVAIGPQTNLAEALRRDPSIAAKARVVAMGGSVYRGHGEPEAEYNIRADVAAARAVLAAPWEVTLAPLDSCGDLILRGENYLAVENSPATLAKIVIENYDTWVHRGRHPADASSVLFDTLAVYLAFDERFCRMETVNISIDDPGHTLPDEAGSPVRCALGWHDREAFERLLVNALVDAEEN